MYRMRNRNQMTVEDFTPILGGKLDGSNRWVQMAEMMPWDMIEDIYAQSFKESNAKGRTPITSRIAFGALFIKENENLSQERTLQHIAENIYMQYFLGLTEFNPKPLFDSSMLSLFAKRFTIEDIKRINEELYRRSKLSECNSDDGDDSGIESDNNNSNDSGGDVDNGSESGRDTYNESDDCGGDADGIIIRFIKDGDCENNGTVIPDATVAPADIRYPTDLSLLNECREATEKIIDDIWDQTERNGHKTPYSRKKARKQYLKIAKQRKPRKKQLRQAIREQLECVEKNVGWLGKILTRINIMSYLKHLAQFETIRKIAEQQRQHYENPGEPIPDRIVSLSQPHVRPMVRGKARGEVEFGQKLGLSIVDGFTFIETQSWDNFAEGNTLIECAEKFRERHGVYPEAILADKTYRNRKNISFCKKYGIRLSGPRLGRPKAAEMEADKEQAYKDGCNRNIVEGRIGVNKRRYGLDLIYGKLDKTAEVEAAMNILCMNVAHLLRVARRLELFLRLLLKRLILTFFCTQYAPCADC